MDSPALVDTLSELSISRPKVHRVPASVIASRRQMRRWPVVASGLLVLTLTVYLGSISDRHSPQITAEPPMPGIVPKVAVTPYDSKVITLSDQGGTIVGQMAKIPTQTEQTADVRSVNTVDNKAGRDLLTIISKY